MIPKLIPRDEIPEDVNMSQHAKEQAKKFLKVQYQGNYYYVPVTKFLNKVIKEHGTHDVEDHVQDIMHLMHIQMQDTIGAQIERSLSQQMREGFEKMFGEAIHNNVNKELDKHNKLLTDDTPKDDSFGETYF